MQLLKTGVVLYILTLRVKDKVQDRVVQMFSSMHAYVCVEDSPDILQNVNSSYS